MHVQVSPEEARKALKGAIDSAPAHWTCTECGYQNSPTAFEECSDCSSDRMDHEGDILPDKEFLQQYHVDGTGDYVEVDSNVCYYLSSDQRLLRAKHPLTRYNIRRL